MAFWRRRVNPIDRAVEDLEKQITTLQKQMRELSANESPGSGGSSANGSGGKAALSPAEKTTRFIKDMLAPPPKKSTAPSYKTRQDLFDVSAEPHKELEAEPIAFSPKTEPDLFAGTTQARVGGHAVANAPEQIDCSTKPDEKLAHYLSAGSIKSYKPLKRVQRQTRNRFFMWLGLSFVALWLLYAVVR
jgi:hypothetical protein